MFWAGLFLLVVAAYANHFRNGFHFDDFHTISDNVYIRNLANVPRFFGDPTTFSTLSANQVYRPLLTTSLALDYWIGGGLNPVAFHASTFAWYLALLALIAVMWRRLYGGHTPAVFFAVALFGVHPVSAETVNYIIQRGDLYATLGVVAALVVYAGWPAQRRYGLYLLPFVLACLAKPTALVFPLLLLVYARLYERERWREVWPAFAAAGAMAGVLGRVTATTFASGGGDRIAYWITQGWVTVGYFRSFFWPDRLSADTDEGLLIGFPAEVWAGAVFVALVLAVALWASRWAEMRPVAFGLAWFLVGLLPTAVMPLAEVANDHRMFLPFVGLAGAVTWVLRSAAARTGASRIAIAAASLVLVASAYATHQRNKVWLNEETLLRDVTVKSPRNGRGLMNYGLTLMAKGHYAGALEYFERARELNPAYSLVEVNLGIAKAGLGRAEEAESHFRKALVLAPGSAQSHSYYGRWLLQQKRYGEVIERLERALEIQPADAPARHLLMQAHFDQQNWSAVRALASETLRLDPTDVSATRLLAAVGRIDVDVARSQDDIRRVPTPDRFLQLSLLHYRSGNFDRSVRAAQDALALRPGYAAAFNNIAAGYNAMGRWNEGIAAAREAVRLDPSNQLARNNLAWAESRRRKER